MLLDKRIIDIYWNILEQKEEQEGRGDLKNDSQNQMPGIGLMIAEILLVIVFLLWSDRSDLVKYGVLFFSTIIGIGGIFFFDKKLKEMEQEKLHEEEQHIKHTQLLMEEINQVTLLNRREMEDFKSALSHSLRMPVAIIQGYAELLEGDMIQDEEVRRQYLQKIIQRSQFISKTMEQQFTVKKESDQLRLTCENMDLLDLVYRVASDMHTAAKDQDIAIHVVALEKQINIKADAYFLNRVLFNLLENAMKYMGRPGNIVIRMMQEEDQVHLIVQDDGMGISEEAAGHIFELNFQASNHAGGQGYGLYLVKQTIEAHGGSVYAKSAPGQGMGIFITLPVNSSGEK